MQTLRLGRTELHVGRVAFGALPIQRIAIEDSTRILHRAVDAGITFFDTARNYTDSEEKMGAALSGMRHKIIIATKTNGTDAAKIRQDIQTSLSNLRTDYVDIYQTHNPKTVPLPGDGTGRYETFLELKASGAIRFIGLTAHSVDNAIKAVQSGLYDTVQFPFSLLASGKDLDLPGMCRDADVGFLGMKGLGGGLIRNIPAAFAFTRRYDNVLPLWGIQTLAELEEFLALDAAPPAWDHSMEEAVQAETAALGKSFCRACAYCLPCPAKIEIPTVARLMPLLGRSPWQRFATPEWQEKIAKTKDCTLCGACKTRCPYELDTPALVAENAAGYRRFMQEKGVL